MPTRNRFLFALLISFIVLRSFTAFAENKQLVLVWPASKPALQVTFGRFTEVSRFNQSSSWIVSTEVENCTENLFPSTFLTLVFYDQANVQIGTTTLYISDPLQPHEKLKRQLDFSTTGNPVRVAFKAEDISLSADHSTAAHTVSMTFRSIPTGATVEVDGKSFGVTPKVLRVPVGSHTAVLRKPGFEPAEYPFEVDPNDSNGGTVEVELATSNDILEMRDGTTVAGDLAKMDWNAVHIMVGGKEIEYPRNLVKRITMVQRLTQTTTPTASAQKGSK